MRNIAVIGIGGVGGYFGGKISQTTANNNEDSLYFVARGKHLAKIKETGLKLKTSNEGEYICKPTDATDNIDDLPLLDICFICVKQYDLNNVLNQLKNKIGSNTKIIALLNGVDIYSRIRKVIKSGVVFPACVYVGTHIEAPGVISQSGGSCTIIFGKDPQNQNVLAEDICDLFDKSSIKYNWTENHIAEIWSKYIFIASYGLVTAYYDKTLGEVFNNPTCSENVKDIMNIIYKISKKEKVNLTEDIVESSYNKANNFPFETKTSFQRDFENKSKPDERELFGESIIELGKKNNINVELIENLYNGLNTIKKRIG